MNANDEKFGWYFRAAIKSAASIEGLSERLIEEELGEALSVTAASIVYYKGGHIPTNPLAIPVIVELGVKRGLLGKSWLEKFLKAAGYIAAEKLISEYFPSIEGLAQPPTNHPYLPGPTYMQFVPRERELHSIFQALTQRPSLIIIHGIGGVGKTALTHEVAYRCLQGAPGIKRMHRVVWISDKDSPGTTDLDTVLDTVAHALDHTGITQEPLPKKRRAVEAVLADPQRQTLIIVDSAETISDESLIRWLAHLPTPSKAIVTTRDLLYRSYKDGIPIPLRGMLQSEAMQLIRQQAHRLGMDRTITTYDPFIDLIIQTDGNPLAIVIALGLIHETGHSLYEVIDNLRAAQGEIFTDLFTRAWEALEHPARRVLLALLLFPSSASRAGIAVVAAVTEDKLDQVIPRLSDLGLLDIRQASVTSTARYELQTLVRTFAQSRLSREPDWAATARERWLMHATHIALQQGGWKWYDIRLLDALAEEEPTIYAAIENATTMLADVAVLQLAEGIDHYYYVRGFWNKKERVDLLRIEAAQRLGNAIEEARAIAQYVQFLCTRGRPRDLAEATQHLTRLRTIDNTGALSNDSNVRVQSQHAYAFFDLAQGQFDSALAALRQCQTYTPSPAENLSIANDHWIATCLYRSGEIVAAKEAFEHVLGRAMASGYQRSCIYSQHHLAKIAIVQDDLERADQLLGASLSQVAAIQERRYRAQLYLTLTRLHLRRGAKDEASVVFATAERELDELQLHTERDELEQLRRDLE